VGELSLHSKDVHVNNYSTYGLFKAYWSPQEKALQLIGPFALGVSNGVS